MQDSQILEMLTYMTKHAVLDADLEGPWPVGTEVIYFGMGCFWGAEKKFWSIPGVVCTAVGYMGGTAQQPTYQQVCSGTTGHAEVVLVAYNPDLVSTYDLLKVFWENHDPTQGNRQGNDVGSQYRSTVYWSTDTQRDLIKQTSLAFNDVLLARGFDPITTEFSSVQDQKFWLAEDYHQQYLIKNPNGYDCHAHTGMLLPPILQN